MSHGGYRTRNVTRKLLTVPYHRKEIVMKVIKESKTYINESCIFTLFIICAFIFNRPRKEIDQYVSLHHILVLIMWLLI